jgi:hypothetical protein
VTDLVALVDDPLGAARDHPAVERKIGRQSDLPSPQEPGMVAEGT